MPAEMKTILTADDIRRALTRMAHEIMEKHHGVEGLLLTGLRTRGVPLAHRIAQIIANFEGSEVPVASLDINLYRDDLNSRKQPTLQSTDFPISVTEMNVVLVDDVLFTGRSIRAALDAIIDLGRPKLVQLAVLIDRGHRELPVRADYVGKNIPTSLEQQIQVKVQEIDGDDRVMLFSSDRIMEA